ncbi:maleate cis-trans isomerase family protein [Labrys neptuniae]
MSKITRLGMLTPSSNTIVEPVTTAMLANLPDVSAHFSRFRVTQIAPSEESDRQFRDEEILKAAQLLADAKVDVIAWNGTSASWLGFAYDEALCTSISAATGIMAGTAVLAFRDVFRRTGASRIGLVTPYVEPIQQRISDNWSKSGFSCAAERHCGLTENFAFAEVTEQDIAAMVRDVAGAGVDAVAIVCTNLRGARVAVDLEAELGIPVYDSVAVTLWASLALTGYPVNRVRGWGRLFGDERLA